MFAYDRPDKLVFQTMSTYIKKSVKRKTGVFRLTLAYIVIIMTTSNMTVGSSPI